MFCYNCGNQLKDGDRFCDKCGLPVEASAKAAEEMAKETDPGAPESAAPAAEPAPQYAPPRYAPAQPEAGESSLMGILSLISGIISIIFGWVPFLMFVPEVLAVIFGIVGIVKKSGKGMAIAGIVLGGVAFLLTTLMTLIVAFIFLGELTSEFFYFPFS